ncbi:MAG: hypothetical protein QG656_900, partial [Candidatus Hydrogenedentes bacterium]|nr:hypothetical protein [Candidatus Hydrogenedentota bacterium]
YETELDSTTGSVLLNRKGLESEKGLDKMKPIWYNLVIEAEEEAKKEVDLFAVSVYD